MPRTLHILPLRLALPLMCGCLTALAVSGADGEPIEAAKGTARQVASHIDIRLHANGDRVALTIEDDGAGIPDNVDPNKGMGLRIMTYRARMIGGQLAVRRRYPAGGTVVECTFTADQAKAETR